MPKLIRPGFATRLAIALAAFVTVLSLAFPIAYEAWTVVSGIAVFLSALAACVTVWWDQIEERFDNRPGLAAAALILSVILGAPALFLYELAPFVPKSRWMKYRSAARRVKRRVRGAIDFHLAGTVSSGREAVPALFLILRRTADAEQLRSHRQQYIDAYREQLAKVHIPDGELERLYVGFVSKNEIRRGGGGFHFWRDGPTLS